MAAAGSISLGPIYKTLFPKGLPEKTLYETNPFFGMVSKNPRFGGDGVKIPIQYRGAVNVGRTLADAQNNAVPVGYKSFRIFDTDLTTRFGVSRWDRQAIMRASFGDALSFVDGMKGEVEGQAYNVGRDVARALWSDGGNTLGQISAGSTVASTTITLANIDDIVNFDEGTVVMAASTNPGVSGAGTVRTGSATILGLDRIAGTLTITGNWSTAITGLTAGDFLFPVNGVDAGAYAVGGYGAKGVPAWIPDVSPAAAGPLFYTVQRGSDATRLAGMRYNGAGNSIDETIQILGTYLKREGQTADTVFLHPKNWHRLNQAANAKTFFQIKPEATGKVTFGYDAFSVVTAAGVVKVVADPQVRSDRVYMLKMDTWKLYSTGKCPETVMDDGDKTSRVVDQNQFELRMVADFVITCSNPASNAVATITAPGF